MVLAAHSDPEDAVESAEDDNPEELAFWRLTMVCLSWLKHRPTGEDYYTRSLVGAAAWSPVVLHGGRPDRKYGIAVAEADLHRALVQLPKLQRDICVLSRNDPRDHGWAQRWHKQMHAWNGAYWTEWLDPYMVPTEGSVPHVKLNQAIKDLIREGAEGMAEFLGTGWLYL
jgi:hypothetical protein